MTTDTPKHAPTLGDILKDLYRKPQGEQVVSGVHPNASTPQPDFDAMKRAIMADGGTSMISDPDGWMASYQALLQSHDQLAAQLAQVTAERDRLATALADIDCAFQNTNYDNDESETHFEEIRALATRALANKGGAGE